MSEYRFDAMMTHCPFCLDDGALVTLQSVVIPGEGRECQKVCRYHGQITNRWFSDKGESVSRPASAGGGQK